MAAVTSNLIREYLGYERPVQMSHVRFPKEHLALVPEKHHDLRGKKARICHQKSYPRNADGVSLQTWTTRLTDIDTGRLGTGKAVLDIFIESMLFRANGHYSIEAVIEPLNPQSMARISAEPYSLRSIIEMKLERMPLQRMSNDLQRVLFGYEILYRHANSASPSKVYERTKSSKFWLAAGL